MKKNWKRLAAAAGALALFGALAVEYHPSPPAQAHPAVVAGAIDPGGSHHPGAIKHGATGWD